MGLAAESSLAIILSILFSTGLISGLSPCTLPTAIFVAAYVSGNQDYSKKKGFILSLSFVSGIVFILTLLGVLASYVGTMLLDTKSLNYIIAVILMVMGLWLLKALNFSSGGNFMQHAPRKGGGIIGAFLLGIPFGFSSSPCTLPITASVLAYAAAKGSIMYGASLMFTFAVGRSIPLVLVGTFTGLINNLQGLAKYQSKIEKLSGILLIGLALYFLWSA